VLETALNQEMTEHLGHEKHGPVTSQAGNTMAPVAIREPPSIAQPVR
jgi:transposase-like protein